VEDPSKGNIMETTYPEGSSRNVFYAAYQCRITYGLNTPFNHHLSPLIEAKE
jgi:hypothetical protein